MTGPADRERAQLLRLAETHDDHAEALSAALIGHARLRDPANPAGWICGCGLKPRMGESHALHAADETLALLTRRRWHP